jgi:hypothetical protein
MGRLASLVGDIFWSALMVVVLLIVGFFILRLAGRAPVVGGVASKAASLATPAG